MTYWWALSQPGVPSDHKTELIMFSPPWMGFRITVGELPELGSSHFLLSALIFNMGLLWYCIQSNVSWECCVMAEYYNSCFLIRYETWERTSCESQNHSFVKQICPPSTTSNVTNDKTELWKTVRQTSFQKPKLQSVSIFLKFVHPCFLLLFILSFNVLSGYFLKFHLIRWQFPLSELWQIWWHSSVKLISEPTYPSVFLFFDFLFELWVSSSSSENSSELRFSSRALRTRRSS